MKHIIALLMAAAIAFSASAADKPASKSFIDGITLAPVGALKTADITGSSQYGAGVDLGVKLNPFVSLHVVNLGFEGVGEEPWGGSVVDETAVLFKAKLAKFSTESFSVYGIGGGLRDWNNDRWGVSVGGGLELAFTKHFSLAADYSLRPYFKPDGNGSSKDSLLRALVNIRF